MTKKIKEIIIRFYEKDKDLVEKIKNMKRIFNEKTENKTILKIIREFQIK